jgi:hypothetical protein
MNPLAFFRELEADQARGDGHEGIDSIIQSRDVELVIDPQVPGLEKIRVAPSELAGPVRIARERTSLCNLFCTFALTGPIDGPVLPKCHQWFGDSFVIFKNTQQFLSRVGTAAKNRGLRIEGRLVEYYDENEYSGEVGRFRKSSLFSYQSEYRIALETGTQGPFRFEIGDLSDITSEVLALDSADEILKFRPSEIEASGLTWD